MLEILTVIVFCWLFFKAVKLALRIAWGGVRFFVSLLLALAIPVLIGCLIFAGGLALLIPLGLVAIGCGLLSAAV